MAGRSDPADPTRDTPLCSALERLCSSGTLRFRPERPVPVVVVALDRYLSDKQSADCYCYDITIADGLWRAKCRLAPDLNRLVQKNVLRCGSGALIVQFALLYDERRLGPCSICLEDVQGDPEALSLFNVKDVEALRWWSGADVRASVLPQADAPLQISRKHYLSLWNNEDPHGGIWLPNAPPPEVAIDVSKICLLGDLEVFFNSSRRPLPLLVRVLHRSRLRYYGKVGQNIDFPFQAYFEVADQSGVMSVVLWNDLCPEWYHRLTVGSVLYLQQFSLKRSYQNRSRPQISHPSLLTFSSIEISLNPRNPSAVITVVPPKSVQPQWGLPDVTYNFLTRSEIESLPNKQACDVIGLVTFVGRVERIRNKGNTVPEKFWTYRWVHAVDGTSDAPFILEIFASSQPEIFNNISPMTYLVCTQMRVCREAGSPLYLTSSTETQLFITGCHRKQPYVSDPKVKAFIQWTKTLKDSVVLRKTTVGGHYCYPPPPPTFTPASSTSSDGTSQASSLSLMAVADLQRELEALQYREHRTLAIQGHITAVHYHHWPPEAPNPGVNPAQHPAPSGPRQLERGGEGVATEASPSFRREEVGPPPSDVIPSPKRRRVEQNTRDVQRQYQTRAKAHAEKQAGSLAEEEEEEEEVESQYDDEESEEGHSSEVSGARSPQTADAGETVSVPERRPAASWESRMWPLLKRGVTEHIRCGPLDPESVAEKFHLDDQDVLLHRINLSPSRWRPELPSDTLTHTPVDCRGYLSLTILGLNQQAAVDSLVLPVFSSEDPRAAGKPCDPHDNTLLSCLSTGRIHAPTGGAHPSPEALVSSAPALEEERVVCVLDVCLLGPNQVEIFCSKIYRTSDINAV